MYGSRFLLVSALTLGLSVAGSAVQAAGADEAAQPAPSGHDRGFYAEDINPQVAAPMVKAAPKVPNLPGVKQHPPAPKSTGNPAGNSVSTIKHTRPSPEPVKNDVSESGSLQNVSHQTSDKVVVTARLNKSGAKPRYKVGEKMEISVTASADCNLVVLDFDGKGNLTQIFPNEYQPAAAMKAGTSMVIGGPDSPFDYQISGKAGEEKIFIYAYPTGGNNPLTVAFAPPAAHSPFRSAEMSLEEYRNLVNNSKVFFSREVKVVPKAGVKLMAASSGGDAPNKVELSYVVEGQ